MVESPLLPRFALQRKLVLRIVQTILIAVTGSAFLYLLYNSMPRRRKHFHNALNKCRLELSLKLKYVVVIEFQKEGFGT